MHMMDQETRQTIVDEEHLKVLSICYYVSAGMTALMSLFGLFYAVIGVIAIASGPNVGSPHEPSPAVVGAIFISIGLGMFGLGLLGAILKIVAGSRIRQRKSRIFCMVVAAIGCLEFPYGTLLGIFTFIILGRSSVRQLFEEAEKELPQSYE